jgi:hypothetical protein
MFTIKQKYMYYLFQYEITYARCGGLLIITIKLDIGFVWLLCICCTFYKHIILTNITHFPKIY